MTQEERLVELFDSSYCPQKDDYYRYEDYIDALAEYLVCRGVIVPPCKVGDEVYCIKPWKLLPDRIQKEKVYRIDYEESKGCTVLTKKGVYYEGEYFHTKAEAEQALKERESIG